MENHCEMKKVRSDEEKRTLRARINRIAGQMNGVGRMVEEDRYCADILIQLAAIDKAVKSLAALMLDSHIHTCLIENIQNGNTDCVEEIAHLFRKFQ